MQKFDNPLSKIEIASPCSADWDSMAGDNRKRFCGDCKLNVYNLSGMTKDEAESLLCNSEGRVCVRFYRRSDGSILIQDCPVGWEKFKQRSRLLATAVASLVFTFLGAIGFQNVLARAGEISEKLPFLSSTPQPLMGAIAPLPSPKPSPKASPKKRGKKNKTTAPPIKSGPELIMGRIKMN